MVLLPILAALRGCSAVPCQILNSRLAVQLELPELWDLESETKQVLLAAAVAPGGLRPCKHGQAYPGP